ncbi:MAG: FHA domain-containing protein [Mariniblastus sp.]
MQDSSLSPNATEWFFLGQYEANTPSSVCINAPFKIGRRPDLDLCLECASVSGLHAEVTEEDGELWVLDCNSTNGTLVNSNRIFEKTRLTDGDTVQFGTAVFRLATSQTEDLDELQSAKPQSVDEGQEGEGKIERELKDADWLLEQPGHSYTVQVMSAISLDCAKRFVDDHSVSGQFAVYEKSGKNRPLYVVVLGVFEDRTRAKIKVAGLTDPTTTPRVRLLSSVHEEIEF